jgi:hypothetical protein
MKDNFTKMETQMYGCTQDQLKQMIKTQAFPGNELMFAAGILSDAQEVISGEFGEPDIETARQFINRAKFIMFNLMRDEREAA